MEYAGLLGGIITTCGGVPQIYKIVKSKSAKDLSWGMLSMWFVGISLSFSYGVYTNQFAIYVPTTISFTMTNIMGWLKYYYSSNTKNESGRETSEYCSLEEVKCDSCTH